MNGSFDWRDAILDASIMAGFTFFAALGGMSITGSEVTQTLAGAAIAAGSEFFFVLCLKRGLRENKT